MAVRHGYGKVAGTDALVFAYDTGDAVNSYKGEPTTNAFIGSSWGGDGANQTFANKNAVTITDPTYQYKNLPTALWTPGTSYNCYLNGTNNLNYSNTSTVWTFSCYIRRSDGGTLRASDNNLAVYLYYPNSDGTGTGTVQNMGDGWYRVWRTRTGSANHITLAGFTGFAAGYKYYLSGWQLEKVSHPTPALPINTTRSVTQGLIDLKGTSTIDLSNVSFDSNAQITFDGTDDYVEIPNTNLPTPGLNHTLECVFQRNSGRTIINYGPSFNGATKYYNLEVPSSVLVANITTSTGSTQLVSSITISSNIWYHGILTYNGSTVSLYINGVLAASASTSGSILNTSTPSLNIGRKNSGNGEYINGKVAVTKIYNRALTADEVRNNFYNYKTRFNI